MKRLLFVTSTILAIILLTKSCGTVKAYTRAEENLCDCIAGVLAPADEFCIKWNQDVNRTRQRLEKRLVKIHKRNPSRAAEIQAKIDNVKAARNRCIEAVSN